MLDRASFFSHPRVIELLSERFVPVALDAWYQIRGSPFFQQVVLQRPDLRARVRLGAPDEHGRVAASAEGLTTQGYYVITPCGQLVAGWTLLDSDERPSEKLVQTLEAVLAQYVPCPPDEALSDDAPALAPTRPAGAWQVGVFARVEEASYATPAEHPAARAYRSAIGRDNLWVLPDEVRALAAGEVPQALAWRIARFHLVDTTRAEPALWPAEQVRELELRFEGEGALVGRARLGDEGAGYEVRLRGRVEVQEGALTRFDLLAVGRAWGQLGADYKAESPQGRYGLAVTFTLEGPRPAAPPYGARAGDGYLAPHP